jgi:hypothetical protein
MGWDGMGWDGMNPPKQILSTALTLIDSSERLHCSNCVSSRISRAHALSGLY